jgi:hypothetical protein
MYSINETGTGEIYLMYLILFTDLIHKQFGKRQFHFKRSLFICY